MGYRLNVTAWDKVISELSQEYLIFAPKLFEMGDRFSDKDMVRYGEIDKAEDIIFNEKSSNSFKEVLMPITQTLFFFTEEQVKEPDLPSKAVIFLRSCDIHALDRLDEIYLRNGEPDYYYSQMRDRIRIVLMGCESAFSSCFCTSMGTNISGDYDFSVDMRDGEYFIDCKNEDWVGMLAKAADETVDVTPAYVTETAIKVTIPEKLDASVAKSSIWDEYDLRCIDCGRCNFSCPTCTCYSMQDIFYTDNGKAGERRRVWASCMVDGFTDVAGGGAYRRKNGERMRFKTLHKVLDFKERFGYQICVGCGRCDDICPEYISFSNVINKLDDAMKEVSQNDEK